MKKLTSILLLLLFSLVLINNASAFSHEGRDWTGQECQKQRISATYTGKSQSAYCREQEEFGNIVGLFFKIFLFVLIGVMAIGICYAIFSPPPKRRHHLHTEHKPTPKPPKLTPKELEEKQARQEENKKKRLAKQKAELDKMTKIINENKAKKNKKK